MLRDLHGALRFLRLHPLFSLSVALTLGLGLTANAGVFTVAYGVLFRAPAVSDPDSLVLIRGREPAEGVGELPSSPAELYDVREQAESLQGVAGYTVSQMNLKLDGRTVRRSGGVVTRGFFELLGVAPLEGRLFRPEDFDRGSTRGILLTEGFWRDQLGGRTDVVGELVDISGKSFEIVGVIPEEVKFNTSVDLWMPLAVSRSEASRESRYLVMLGRAADGFTQREVEQELGLISERLAAAYPETNSGRIFEVQPLRAALRADSKVILSSLFGASVILLILAVVNASHLALVQVASRRGELATRLALGGRRLTVARRLVTEGLVLALGGCSLGLLGSALTVGASMRLGLVPLQGAHRIAFDEQTVLYCLGVSLVVGLLLGLVAASRVPAGGLTEALTAAEEVSPAGVGKGTVRDLLFVVQVAAVFVLVVAAGTMIRQVQVLTQTETGFDVERVTTVTTVFPSTEYPPGSEGLASYLDRAVRGLEELPTVEAAASGILSPTEGAGLRRRLEIEPGPGGGKAVELEGLVQPVSPGYFETLGIDVLAGRALQGDDTGRAAVVNRRFADHYLGGEPLGRMVRIDSPFTEGARRVETVGVVESVRQGDLREDPVPALYVAHELELMPFATLFVRSREQTDDTADAVLKTISQLDPDVAVDEPRRMAEAFSQSIARERASAWLLGLFGALGLGVALVGIYGIMSLMVARRTREFGIRFSLGAERGKVLGEVLAKSAKLTLGGILVGLAAVLIFRGPLENLSPAVDLADASFLAVVGGFLGLSSLAGCLVPALRASRISPLAAIRTDQ